MYLLHEDQNSSVPVSRQFYSVLKLSRNAPERRSGTSLTAGAALRYFSAGCRWSAARSQDGTISQNWRSASDVRRRYRRNGIIDGAWPSIQINVQQCRYSVTV